MNEPLSLELVAYRLEQAEMVQRAMQVELYDLRKERELYVKRADIEHQAELRRQWPVTLATIAMACTSLVNVILIATHH